jgi:hypothetical protein
MNFPPRKSRLVWLLTFATTITICIAAPGDVFFQDPAPLRIAISVSTDYIASLNAKSRVYAPVTVRFGTNEAVEVGMRLRGVSSFQKMDGKPAFALKLNDRSAKAHVDGLSKLLFNNCSADVCAIRESLACSLFLRAGVPAARTRPVRVTINGRELGIYLAVEAMNKDFLRRHFGNDSGDLYEGTVRDIHRQLELDNGTDVHGQHTKALYNACLEQDLNKRWNELNEMVDVDRFFRFAAMQVLLGHMDGYLQNRNNYRIYRDTISHKMVFIPHGLDSAFIRGGDVSPPQTNGAVMHALYATPQGKELYTRVAAALVTNVWTTAFLAEEIKLCHQRLAALCDGPAETEKLQHCSGFLTNQVFGRQQELLAWVAEPEPKTVALAERAALTLTNWFPFTRTGEPALFVTNNLSQRFLRIQAMHPASCGWRSRLRLPEGEYVFSCRLRASSPGQSRVAANGPAVIVRLAGELGGASLTKVEEWQELTYRFAANPEGRLAEFLCELQAGTADVWLDLDSVQIARVK